MWILDGWSNGAYDVKIGISRYIHFKNFESFTEFGFNQLVRYCHSLKMPYRTFFVICSFVELTVLFWFVNKNCKKPVIAFGLFMIYPLVIYFQYIRSILAFTFVLLALDCLLNQPRHFILKYIVLILIGSSIHFSSFIFLAYISLVFFRRKTIFVGTIFFMFCSFGLNAVPLFSNLLSSVMGKEKEDIVLRTTINSEGSFGRIIALLSTIFIFFIIYYMLEKKYKIKMNDHISDLYFKMNVLSFIFIPFTINFGIGFSRIPTLLLMVNYVFFVNKISEIPQQKQRSLIYSVLVMLLLSLAFIKYRNIEYRTLVLYPFFEDNSLINLL